MKKRFALFLVLVLFVPESCSCPAQYNLLKNGEPPSLSERSRVLTNFHSYLTTVGFEWDRDFISSYWPKGYLRLSNGLVVVDDWVDHLVVLERKDTLYLFFPTEVFPGETHESVELNEFLFQAEGFIAKNMDRSIDVSLMGLDDYQ